MSARKTLPAPIVVRSVGPRSVEFTGPRLILDTIVRLRLRFMRHRHGGGWLIRKGDLNDLLAALEADGHHVLVELDVW